MLNLFDFQDEYGEHTEIVFEDGQLRIERIVSKGAASPDGYWYDQEEDEWVFLLQGNASLKFDDSTCVPLGKGDNIFIPAHKKHRVEFTSKQPCCVWLCVFRKPVN